MKKKSNSRALAADTAWQIIDRGQSLDAALQHCFDKHPDRQSEYGFIQELVYGVCRWYGELDAVAQTFLQKPIRSKDRVVHFALLVGLYQLRHLKTAEHAAVSETVSACAQLGKPWAGKLANGCLRAYLRSPTQLPTSASRLSHPDWLIKLIEQAWPEHSQVLMDANNQRPAMCLRVNAMQHSRDDYLQLLREHELLAETDPASADGIIMTQAVPVQALPGFFDGSVSVQDTAAQLACNILAAETDQNVLDACAAPGGKTAHLLERHHNQLQLLAVDISERRCEQLKATLTRLKLNAKIQVADASDTASWEHPTNGYHRILIDAPCSGTGVIRRHPDIRHHRRPTDLQQLQKIQANLLDNLWPALQPGGQLLYMTCSILPSENELQIARFLGLQNDAMLIPFAHPNALQLTHGQQTLQGVHGMDGFYYCLIAKRK